MLKKLNIAITEHLAIILNKSIVNGIFPDAFKIAKLIAIFESKENNQLNNYRPMSLLSSISKIFEKILYNFIK